MAANGDELKRKLRAGIEAARRGDRVTARRLLEQVVVADERNELAWIWLASVVNTLAERRTCLEKALEINPSNTRARDALRKLTQESRQRTEEDSQAVERLRRLERAREQASAAAPPRPSPERERSGFKIGYVLIGVLVIVAVGVAAVVASNLLRPQPTRVAAVATATATRQAPTSTRVLATPRLLATVTLPPTFTPTDTATPTITFTPTETPLPLSVFEVFYTSLESGAGQPGLYRINADGSGEEFVAADVREIVYDPSGSNVAFVRDVAFPADERRTQGGVAPELFVAPSGDFEAAQQITDLRAPHTGGPSWSPDGGQIVFYSDADGNQELYAVETDGRNIRQLTMTEGVVNREPSWSPDGAQIVFASDRNTPGFTEIFSLEVAAGEAAVSQLTDDSGSSYAPVWSPNGSLIVFVSDRGGDGDVYLMDARGERPQLLTRSDDGAEDRIPVFTPDMRWVVFVSIREDDLFQTYLVSLRGDEVVRLTRNGRDDQSLAVRSEVLVRAQ